MHRFLKFIFGMKLYIFRTVPVQYCPKNVELHSKNKFEISVNLVGFCYKNIAPFFGIAIIRKAILCTN
jgi:hypothetical protein